VAVWRTNSWRIEPRTWNEYVTNWSGRWGKGT
jgi:hypothetical protein